MVRFDCEELRDAAVALWHEAFGDSEEYIRFFHSSHCGCHCLTLTENGELTSALYLIDGRLCGESGYYLFAAATFKKHRGKGCMASLLKKAKQFALENKKSFIALVPAEKSLFDYYLRFGYKTAFYAKREDIKNLSLFEKNERFKWCDAHIEYIKAEHEKYGTDIIEHGGEMFSVFDGGYIKAPAEKCEENRYGMLLPLNEKADKLTELNSYIGLTME